jgi:hypothetical protein
MSAIGAMTFLAVWHGSSIAQRNRACKILNQKSYCILSTRISKERTKQLNRGTAVLQQKTSFLSTLGLFKKYIQNI